MFVKLMYSQTRKGEEMANWTEGYSNEFNASSANATLQLRVNHLIFPLSTSPFFSLYPHLYKLQVWAGISSSRAFGSLTCGSLI